MQTRDEVEGLHNCQEFSQCLECLYQAMHVPTTEDIYNICCGSILSLVQIFFLLFLGMVMYDNNMIMSLKQKTRKFEPRIKLNHNIYILGIQRVKMPTSTDEPPSCGWATNSYTFLVLEDAKKKKGNLNWGATKPPFLILWDPNLDWWGIEPLSHLNTVKSRFMDTRLIQTSLLQIVCLVPRERKPLHFL